MRKIQDTSLKIKPFAEDVRKRMALCREISDETVREFCQDSVLGSSSACFLSLEEKAHLIEKVFWTLRRELEILHGLTEDPEITEIMVNGADDIFIEKGGVISKTDLAFDDRDSLERVIRRLAGRVGREMNDLNPIVDARLSDGSRINAVNSNIAIDGPVLTIRRFTAGRLTMDDLTAKGDITGEEAEFLKMAVICRYNIIISGGTGSGKTTFLNILSDFIPPEERLVVIEDSAELQIRNHSDTVRMEAKPSNAQGKGEVAIRDLIRTSLRMRPDRIIVGEVRGAEVIDMLSAMSTGHAGSLSTGHANSSLGMVRRLESLFLSFSGFPLEAVRAQIAEGIDLFVHLRRMNDGSRRVYEICELESFQDGKIKLNYLYKNGKKIGELVNKEKIEIYGNGLFSIQDE